MNKTDRLLAIVLELQRKKLVRAEDLADTFETSIRTIYRDIQALCEAGVPVIGAPGQGYSLMEGYFLPPVRFTAEEAVTLLLGTDFIEQRFDKDYGLRALSSRNKIEAVLPENVRHEAARIRQTMRLILPDKDTVSGKEKDYMKAIRHAILQRRKLKFDYLKNIPDSSGSRHSQRTAAPYGLVFVQSSWALIAWCELRQDIRHFRVSRMTDLSVLEENYEILPDFKLENYRPIDDRRLTVRILVHPDMADRVMESNNFYMEAAEEREDGLHMVLRVRRTEELLHWVLGWGSGIVVLEPESFRNQIRNEAENMLKRY
ncbi:helix-turn-helix transcriptional regulator [Paenibacillus sp. DMB20]|uniref:helix-turn-helix transcriptional regulator n=1 Tax=Paenibacillus sp. DMB20 TaxID=1642570 RepID=UPI000627E21C|nr:YafY family protein [Paenibacillus sp. DMB20]KKO53202.1 transcriptional regulator [Paenibacillus sp. DMB20]